MSIPGIDCAQAGLAASANAAASGAAVGAIFIAGT